MEIPKQYSPKGAEDKWYAYWLEQGYFKSVPDEREPFTIVIPPPNVTGVLHMGHMLNNTIQDILVRRARMQGFNTCWLPGTDHASIATEAKVVAKLREEGIDKKTLSREEFLDHAWEWKEKHGGIILEQLKKLGASCDWDRTAFTMDEKLSDSVIRVFVDLYNKGLIYRGVRMVNWDPKALTALSDEEVIYKELQSKFYYLRYRIEGTEDEYVTIATTRPETILGDTGICVHPEDPRYQHLKGKRALVPLINRSIPFIFDEYVDRDFGTGALKVTPAHDINDYNLGIKHNLPSIDIFNPNGTLNESAEIYIGEDRFVVREKIAKELEARGHLVKVENITNNVGFSERTDEVIEPKLSLQWFLKMEEMAKPALEVVMNDTIHFHPAKFKNIYRHWMENVRDWCISRQLWWGHRIPAWYLPDGKIVVALNAEEALEKARKEHNPDLQAADLKQDEDVLDTWFSSWLWPISVFDGINHPDNPEIKYYYPTNDLVTAPEILFFWVARMIMAGLEYRQDIPFKNVYLTGIVRDKLGRKMSKSLGNSPDPIELMEHYGADGVRVGMLFSSPAGNDLLFDEALCEQGRNFSNKIWNAFRLTQSWEIDKSIPQPETARVAIEWFHANINKHIKTINDHLNKFRIADALLSIYKLIWDDFCSWYLEMVKPAYQKPIDAKTYEATIVFFDELLRLLHPYMPFISEEIYQRLRKDSDPESIVIAPFPKGGPFKEEILAGFDFAEEVIMAIRNFRQEKNIPNKETLELCIKKNHDEKPDTTFDSTVMKMCNLSKLDYTDEKPADVFTLIIKTTEFYIPLSQNVDIEAEIEKLETDLKYQQGFLATVEKKLSNERFVSGAPEQVVAVEKKKQADALARISVIKAQLKNLKKN
ncbi:MAG: valine--tRNA ligase [Bacteroidales bacterium]|jgi:valyl-tRNA synthetase|nr:valine--tRNA ligase [Bacteroidales bacterium]